METARKFVSYFGDFWKKAKQEIPTILSIVNPYHTVITSIKKGYDKLQKMVKQDRIEERNQNVENAENHNEQSPSTPSNYEVHEPAKQFKNIAKTYLIREKLEN